MQRFPVTSMRLPSGSVMGCGQWVMFRSRAIYVLVAQNGLDLRRQRAWLEQAIAEIYILEV